MKNPSRKKRLIKYANDMIKHHDEMRELRDGTFKFENAEFKYKQAARNYINLRDNKPVNDLCIICNYSHAMLPKYYCAGCMPADECNWKEKETK